MGPRELKIGDVVQIDPAHDTWCAGCFMVVTEPKSWGAIGWVGVVRDKDNPPGMAYYRCEWANMEFVGTATWVTE